MRIIPRLPKHQNQSHGLNLLLLVLLLAFAALSPAQATITGSTFTPSTYSAGAVTTVDVALTTSLDVPVGGALVITFPLGFYANPTVTSPTNPSGIDASSVVSASPGESSVVTITIAGTIMAAGTIAFTLDNIFNPGTGTTAMFKVQSFDGSGNVLETSSNIAGLSIVQGTTLIDAQLSLASPNAGVATVFTVTFTTGIWLRAGCTIELQFPMLPSSQFIIPGVTFAAVSGVDAASNVVTVTPATNTVILTLAGAGSLSGASVSVGFGSIFNPAAQTMGSAVFAVRTRDPQGRIYQANTAVAGTTIVSTTLSATVTPTSYWAGNVTTYTLSFDNNAYLPQGSVITFMFNTRFDFSAVSLGMLISLPRVNIALVIGTNTLKLTLGVGPVLAGSNRAFTVNNVLNPGSSCNEYEVTYCTTTWEAYSISIADAGGNIFEQNAAVTGTPIVITPMSFGRVRPLLKDPLTTTSMTLLFNTQVKVPIGGQVQVVLPTGFVIADSSLVVASGQTYISASSTTVVVSGLQIALTIAGAVITPPSTGVSVTFSSITTPTIDTTGTYTIRTLDSYGAVLEEIDNIIGEACWTLNGCNNRGTCTLFSHTCICDRGWGAPTDITDYSAPDCTMRKCDQTMNGTAWMPSLTWTCDCCRRLPRRLRLEYDSNKLNGRSLAAT